MILTPLVVLTILYLAPPTTPSVTRIPCADGTFPGRIPPPDEPLFNAREGDDCVFIDRSGSVVMRALATGCGPFVDGFAHLSGYRKAGTWAYLSRDGSVVEIGDVDSTDMLADGMVRFRVPANRFPNISWKFGFIDLARAVVAIPPIYDDAGEFSERLVRVNQGASNWNRGYIVGGRWGFVDKDGEEVIPFRLDAAGDFHEGLAAAAKGVQWGYIDRSGEWVIPSIFSEVDRFSGGLAAVYDTISGNVKYIDKSGATVLATSFPLGKRFSEGLAHVSSSLASGADGFIDTSGHLAVPLKFAYARDFSEGLAAVIPGEEVSGLIWGYVDKAGRIVIRPRFSFAGDFAGGLAQVSIPRHESRSSQVYIDRTGQQVWPPVKKEDGE